MTQRCPRVGQVYPYSMVQNPLQPSPLVEFPSSHVSRPSIVELPQRSTPPSVRPALPAAPPFPPRVGLKPLPPLATLPEPDVPTELPEPDGGGVLPEGALHPLVSRTSQTSSPAISQPKTERIAGLPAK